MSTLRIVASDGVVSADRIKPKERDTLIQALRAGVVPRSGLRHIQVGAPVKSLSWSATSSASPTKAPRSVSSSAITAAARRSS